jgi:hypothetical protein
MYISPTVQWPHHLRQTPWYSLDNRQSHIRDRHCREQHYPVPWSGLNPDHRDDSCSIYESAQAQNQFRSLLQHEVKNCVCSRCRLGSLTSRPSLCVQDAAREVGCWLAGWLAAGHRTVRPHLLLPRTCCSAWFCPGHSNSEIMRFCESGAYRVLPGRTSDCCIGHVSVINVQNVFHT